MCREPAERVKERRARRRTPRQRPYPAVASGRGTRVMFMAAALIAPLMAQPSWAEDEPPYLRDRGSGVATSMFGSYVREGELLLYPFFEAYVDPDLEYKPSEFGYADENDYRGDYGASEGLLFLAYGISRNVALEIEAAVISAELEKAASDPSAMPGEVTESGLGDVEAQVRWRWLEETENRPEAFTYFETVFPLQKHRRLIGTRDWEHKLGVGVTRGLSWGTLTARAAVDYSREERKFDAGEYAVEYLKRLSPAWRIVAAVEGNQLDEVALLTEAQWHLSPRAILKLNNGWGLTSNATKLAPELGMMFSF